MERKYYRKKDGELVDANDFPNPDYPSSEDRKNFLIKLAIVILILCSAGVVLYFLGLMF